MKPHTRRYRDALERILATELGPPPHTAESLFAAIQSVARIAREALVPSFHPVATAVDRLAFRRVPSEKP